MRHHLVLLAAIALTAPVEGAGVPYVPCAISAYVIDQDPKGMNVRASPSSAAPVLKVVGGPGAGTVRIRGFQGGWFRVSRIDAAEEDAILFRGDGWVHGSLLHVDVAAADPTLYAGPSRKARVLRRLASDQQDVTLVSCKGEWAQIRVQGTLGWLSPAGQCSNPLTTCA